MIRRSSVIALVVAAAVFGGLTGAVLSALVQGGGSEGPAPSAYSSTPTEDRAWQQVAADAGLVLRLIREGGRAGGQARSYIRVESLVRGPGGEVLGASLTMVDWGWLATWSRGCNCRGD